MPRITAIFSDRPSADAAMAVLTQDGITPEDVIILEADRDGSESRFMAHLVIIIVAWSIVGTAIGAALGALIAYTVGPSGTEGLILQMVSWAIFVHMLGGLWAGYLLLADRTSDDLPGVRATTRLVVNLTEPARVDMMAGRLRALGATEVSESMEPPRR